METLINTLTSYVPAFISSRLVTAPTSVTEPSVEHFDAAVLFADISGFTPLTERLAAYGAAGVEELSRRLNVYFGRLTDLVIAHGGDVVKFAGDALLAIWPAADRDDLEEAAVRAAQCGLAVQEALRHYAHAPQDPLRLRVAIGTGRVAAVHVGGLYRRWEFLLAGDPLAQVGLIEKQVRPSGVILSSKVWDLISHRCTGEIAPTGAVHLMAVHKFVSPCALASSSLSEQARDALWAYVPGAIRARLAAGQSGWLAELRTLTVLFINLPDLNHTTPLELAQQMMRSLQEGLYRYEGSVNKISVDEKGSTLVAAMGLPPMAHEDDAARGIQAALAMHSALDTLGVRHAIGVTTGAVFCGSIGSERRREYAIIGDVVNLSARLMQAALHHETAKVLCDAVTYQAAQTAIAFKTLPPVHVKGKTEPVSLYQPVREQRMARRSRTEMVGRETERMRLAEQLQALLMHESGVIIIEGEAGIGKSCLVEDVVRQAKALDLTCWIGTGDAVEKSTPYFAWRTIFATLFDLDLTARSIEEERARVMEYIETQHPDLLPLAPLLNAVLPLDLVDNDLTAQLHGEGRATRTHEMLLTLLKATARTSPLLLILEDAHWLDSASWALARLVYQEVHPLLLILATRPLSDPKPLVYTYLRDAHDTQHILLTSLPPQAINKLICQRLGVHCLPQMVEDLLQTEAEGHPFFSEELAYALRDAGLICVVEGACHIAPDKGDLHALHLPDTIQGVITARIDQLSPQQQLTLKVASVIGRVFAFRILSNIHPIEADRPHLIQYLENLAKLDITPLEAPEPDLAYIFRHIITQEVAYNLMAFAQRRRLHRAVAEWYEQTYRGDLSPYYSLLAYHWRRAVGEEYAACGPDLDLSMLSKAVDYQEKAGDQALLSNANREAVDFFNALLGCTAAGHAMPITPLRQAHWERQLGQAYYGLGQLKEARAHYERAVTLLGRPMPTKKIGVAVSLLLEFLRQILHRLHLPEVKRHSPKLQAMILEAAQAYERLGEICYQANESIMAMYTGLCALNLAERTGSAPDLARIYGFMCIAASLIPFHKLAVIYSRRAHQNTDTADLSTSARVLITIGLYATAEGQWKTAHDYFKRSAEMEQQLGNRRQWDESRALLSWIYYFQGDFSHSMGLWREVHASAHRHQDPWSQIWGLCGQVENGFPTGQSISEAIGLLENAQALLSEDVSYPEQIRVHGLWAKVYQRQGAWDRAQQAMEDVLSWIAKTRPTAIYAIEGYASAAEAGVMLWEAAIRGENPTDPTELRKVARQACQAFNKFAHIFPIAQPRARLWQSVYAWLNGNPYRARRLGEASIAAALRLGMPYDEALGHYHLGGFLPMDDAAHREHLAQATVLFERIAAVGDLEKMG
jgi:class 3 adenylate cyclase/tetratricopeptide (TPR) repeat protein